ncbi:MAG TPA: hypothetical protein P5079_00130 [Elusimicrobiota bacterium]|nr:hypothetical protein [Elusimicrobiota bacterium]
MKSTCSLLIPFDLGLELDFEGKDAREIVKEVSSRPAAPLTFEGRIFSNATITTRIYKFGVGLIQLSFPVEGDIGFLTALSCRAEAIAVGKTAVSTWARTLVDGLIERARKFASHTYERRLEEVDIFPVFVFEKGVVSSAGEFVKRNHKALFGIVSGEANYDDLSDFALEQERLVNFGYYENELILIKRFGAVVSSGEAHTILELIRLAYALFWNLRGYNFFLDREIDSAQALISRLPPYYKVWVMPQRYQMFSREAMGFGIDKLAIVDSLYNVSANIPHIDSDWHLRTIYRNVQKEFDIDELSKMVEVKLERIEDTYNSARDFLSTNFFIAVEIVLILSLFWMVLDTSLLFTIAQK